ncbi:MAG: peptidylprolyl isomerase [Candidatus Berkelbacteria bacterium]
MGRKQRERKEKKLEELAAQRSEIKSRSNFFDPRRFFMSPIFIVFTVCIVALIAYPFVYAKYIPHGKYAILETSEGNIKIELRADKAPKTVANFVGLAKDGFYQNMIWHRVVKGFVIQTGDPTGTGTGGAGHQVDDEISDLNFTAGIVGVANAGANTNDSQFFITTADAQESLNGKYTSFGQVVEGMDVVKKIEAHEVNDKEVPNVSVDLKNVIIK